MPQDDLLLAIERDPGDALAWLALADCLEEAGQADRAELVRLREWLRFADRLDPLRAEKQKRLHSLLAAGVVPAGPRLVLQLGKIPLTLSLIPPGTFWMGTAGEEGDEGLQETPRHLVTLRRGFWLGVVPVTQAQWEAVIGDRPSYFLTEDRPVETITWTRGHNFCRELGQRVGGKFRYPTEAEWEYACRAGTYSRFHSGDSEESLQQVGWYSGSAEDGTTAVGQLTPNAWGLHDMHGNVYEWCEDRLRRYTTEAVTDPRGKERQSHCIRGGFWGRTAGKCRSAFRDTYSRGSRASIAGMRVLRVL